MAQKGLAGWPVKPVEPVKKGIMSNLMFYRKTGQQANWLNPI